MTHETNTPENSYELNQGFINKCCKSFSNVKDALISKNKDALKMNEKFWESMIGGAKNQPYEVVAFFKREMDDILNKNEVPICCIKKTNFFGHAQSMLSDIMMWNKSNDDLVHEAVELKKNLEKSKKPLFI